MGFRGLAVGALLCVSVLGAPGDRKWSFPLAGPISSPAQSANGDVIVSDRSGQTFSITTAGISRWTFPGADRTNNVPVVGPDGTIYVAGSRLIAIDASGALKWTFPSSVPAEAQLAFRTPVVGPDGAIYSARSEVGKETQLVAVNPDGSPRWAIPGDFTTPLSVEADGSLIYLKAAAFGRLNPDGLALWEVPFLDPHHHPVSLTADGTILLPVQNSGVAAGRLQAYASTGSPVWFQEIVNPVGTAVGADGKMYVATEAGLVRALGTAREVLWERQLPPGLGNVQILGTVAVGADGWVYATCGGTLHALDASGNIAWSHSSGLPFATPPLLATDGTVYFAAFDAGAAPGTLIAVETGASGPSLVGWPMFLRSATRNAALPAQLELPSVPTGVRGSVDLFTDKIVVTWSSAPDAVFYDIYRQPSDQSESPILIAQSITGRTSYEDRPPLAATGYRYFVEARNALGSSGRSAFGSGRRRVANPGEVAWAFAAQGAIQPGLATSVDGSIYVASAGGFLHSLTTGGVLNWRVPFGGQSAGPITVSEDTIYLVSDSVAGGTFGLRAFALDGQLRWVLPLNGKTLPGIALGTNGIVYLGDDEGTDGSPARLLAVSTQGTINWSFPVEGGLASAPLIGAEGRIYLASRLGTALCVSPAGEEVWRIETDDFELTGPVQTSQGLLLFGGEAARGINPDGRVRWTIPAIDRALPRAVDVFDQGLFYLDGEVTALGTTGDVIWRTAAAGAAGDTFATDSDWRIYATINGRIQVFSYLGEPEGEFTSMNSVSAGPVLDAGQLIFGDSGGLLSSVRIDLPPGTSAWPSTGHDSQNSRRQTLSTAPSEGPQVLASQGTGPTIVVDWTSVLGATDYTIFRAGTRVFSQATQIGQVSGRLSFEDPNVLVARTYYYWVQARNAAGLGPRSEPASGFRQPPNLGDIIGEWSFDGRVSGPPAFAGPQIYVSVSAPDGENPGHAGLYALEGAGEVRWSYPINARQVWPPSVGADGTIFVAAQPGIPLTAVNSNGLPRWTAPLTGNATGTPVLSRLGRILCATDQGRVHAFETNGAPVWTYDAGSPISSPLAIGPNDAVFAITDTGVLHALSSNGLLRWKAPTLGTLFGDLPRQAVSVDGNGVVYVGSSTASAVAFQTDGTVKWRLATGSTYSTPLVRPDNTLLVLRPEGQFSALNDAGGTLWTYLMGSPPSTHPVASEIAVYSCSADGRLHAVSSRGVRLWTLQLPAAATHLGVGPTGTIYVGSPDGNLHAIYQISPQLGQQWTGYQADLRHSGRVQGSVAIPSAPENPAASQSLYTDRVELSWASVPSAWYYEIWRGLGPASDFLLPVAKISGTNKFVDRGIEVDQAYSYRIRAGNDTGVGQFSTRVAGSRRSFLPGDILAEAPLNFARPRGLAASGGQIVLATEGGLYGFGSDLSPRWSVESPGQGYFAPSIGSDGTVLAGRSDFVLTALQSGGQARWSITNLGTITGSSAVGSDGRIYCYAGEGLIAANLAGESFAPVTASAPGGASPVLGADGTIYAFVEKQTLAAYSSQGLELWRLALSAIPSSSPAIGSDGTTYFGCQNGSLCAVLPQGRMAWNFQPPVSQPAGPPVVSPLGTIYFGAGASLHAVLPDGTQGWAFDLPGVVDQAPTVASDGTVFAVTRAGTLHAISEKGSRLWDAALDRGEIAAPLFLPDGRLILASEVSLLALHTGKQPADFPWPTAGQNLRRTGQSVASVRLDPEPPGGVYANGSVTFHPFISGSVAITNLLLRRDGEILAIAADPQGPLVWQGLLPGTNHFLLEMNDALGRTFVKHAPVIQADLVLHQSWPGTGDLALQTARLPGWKYFLETSTDLVQWTSGPAPTLETFEVVWILPAIGNAGPATLYRARAEQE